MCFTFLLYIQVPLGCVTPFAVINEYAGRILQNTMSPPPQQQQMENPNVQVLREPLCLQWLYAPTTFALTRSRVAPCYPVINSVSLIALCNV